MWKEHSLIATQSLELIFHQSRSILIWLQVATKEWAHQCTQHNNILFIFILKLSIPRFKNERGILSFRIDKWFALR